MYNDSFYLIVNYSLGNIIFFFFILPLWQRLVDTHNQSVDNKLKNTLIN